MAGYDWEKGARGLSRAGKGPLTSSCEAASSAAALVYKNGSLDLNWRYGTILLSPDWKCGLLLTPIMG